MEFLTDSDSLSALVKTVGATSVLIGVLIGAVRKALVALLPLLSDSVNARAVRIEKAKNKSK